MKSIAKHVLTVFLISGLVLLPTVGLTGCNASQFETVLNEVGPAIGTILQIIAIVKGGAANLSLSSKVGADVAGIEKLYADFEAANSASKGAIKAEINAGFTTLNADLGTVFAIAQVSDKNTQAKITALIGLVQSAIAIAEAAMPSSSPSAAVVTPLSLDANSLVSSFNKILVAKTGNPAVDRATPHMKLHIHGGFVRMASMGFAQ
ncbi:MAG: hypothetical protein ACRD4V_02795 [Candidatus Acidiferrales bacterium]